MTDPHLDPRMASAALLTIDVQRDFLSGSPHGVPGTTEILPNLRDLVAAFRSAGRPIVHVVRFYEKGGGNADLARRRLLESGAELVTPGSPGSRLAPGLAPDAAPELDHELLLAGRPQPLGPGEFAVFKPRWGAFYETPLNALLRREGVDTVVVAGCNLPNCPRATMVEASERDYRVVAVTDALSAVTGGALTEIAGIGVRLRDTAEVCASLD